VNGPEPSSTPGDDTAPPAGEVYDWYRRGLELLAGRSPAAAAQLLEHAATAEPDSRSVREALARAHYDAGHYEAARLVFVELATADPADDYALFGVGLCSVRLGDLSVAVEHLALAVAMRPELSHYRSALVNARARLAELEG
jgi:Flp pilus assembly protein TadD